MIGKKINGYLVADFKGGGSFGSVYTCKRDQNTFAIKIFNSNYVLEQYGKYGDNNRIKREIEALKRVQHSNVVKYIDDGVFTDNGSEYIYVIMDYVEGDDLAQYIKKRKLTITEAIKIFNEILGGIEAIHNENIVHRDLKPANIYISTDGAIKVLDFGLSKLIDFTSITSTGVMVGSPLYMSPEQVVDSKNIDYRSDYYTLGVIFYELLSGYNPYGKVQSREELYYKIINEPPIPITNYLPTIDNNLDNLLLQLLEKRNYKRPNSVVDIRSTFMNSLPTRKRDQAVLTDLRPTFFLRVWNEKQVLIDYYNDGYEIEHAIFPINHQERQRNLLKHLKDTPVDFFIDPATMRLAYDTFSEVKGLIELPYAPQNLNRLEINDLATISAKRDYVKKVVDEQLKHSPNYVVAPFHVSNNSNLIRIKATDEENWFSLDVKLLKETKDYLNSITSKAKLIGGFCIKTDILTTKTEREYFLNVLSGLPCDFYWVYVDCIDNGSNLSEVYNYILTLTELQKATRKPVIAGRVGSIGLLLLAFGIYGFESGASRFESFYEDLYKDQKDPYNMYLSYYMPELMRNISIERKNPARIINILQSKVGEELSCSCPYCVGKRPEELVNESLSKKHFLYRRQEELNEMKQILGINDRIRYLEEKIKKAIEYHKILRPLYKDDDFKYLKTWMTAIEELKKVCEFI